jgi:hypothetical protein
MYTVRSKYRRVQLHLFAWIYRLKNNFFIISSYTILVTNFSYYRCFYLFVLGKHCENNLACVNVTCQNNGQCIEGVNNYTCLCSQFFSGRHCETKNEELKILENVSQSISFSAIACVSIYVLFVVLFDASKYLFKMEPTSLNEHRERLRIKHTKKKIDKEKQKLLKRYKELSKAVKKSRELEFKSIKIADLKWIDDETSLH